MKEFAEMLLAPSGVLAVLALAGMVLLIVPRWRRWAPWPLALMAISYLAFSSSVVARALLGPLEYEHAPVQDRAPQASIDTLVVLTGFAEPDVDMSLTGEVNRASGMRLLEAARLFVRQHNASVIISGKEDVATVMKNVLVALKVPAQRIAIEGQSMNTYESAVNLRRQLGDKPFYLITSAGHMPRAMAVLTKQGLRPVPAPTDYLVAKGFRKVMPWISGGHLESSDLAVHEHIGRWWYSLTDRL